MELVPVAYCSCCFRKTAHVPQERNRLRRTVYRCEWCGNRTLACRYCDQMAQGGAHWDNELCAVHNGILQSFESLDVRLETLDEYPSLASGIPASRAWDFLPGGSAVKGYFGPVEGFGIVKKKEGRSPAVLYVNGFLRGTEEDTSDWENQLRSVYPHNAWYYVTWEAENLRDIGRFIVDATGRAVVSKGLRLLASRALGARAAGIIGRIGWPFLIADLLGNPWHVAMYKAQKAGVLLAIVLARVKRQKFILAGHSLGARVIYYALDCLADQKSRKVVKAHLLGGAVGNDDREGWKKCASITRSGIVNYHTSNDTTLKYLYKAGNLFSSTPVGIDRLPHRIRGVRNVDVSEYVSRHGKFIRGFCRYAKR